MDVSIKIHNKIGKLLNEYRDDVRRRDPDLILVSKEWFLEVFNSTMQSSLYYDSIEDYLADFTAQEAEYMGIRFECMETLGQEYKYLHLGIEEVCIFETMLNKIQSRSITGNYNPVYHYLKSNR